MPAIMHFVILKKNFLLNSQFRSQKLDFPFYVIIRSLKRYSIIIMHKQHIMYNVNQKKVYTKLKSTKLHSENKITAYSLSENNCCVHTTLCWQGLSLGLVQVE